MTGVNNSSVIGNNQNNLFAGNIGNNFFDGADGIDTVKFKGNYSEYNIITLGDKVVITDLISNRDGIDSIKNIEVLKFSDLTIAVGNVGLKNGKVKKKLNY